jgi:fructose-bisphosphate aldolase class II
MPDEQKPVKDVTTCVDFLAASIETLHGCMPGEPERDYRRLQQIDEARRIPFVMYGGAGLSDGWFPRPIENGSTQVDYYAVLAGVAAASKAGAGP